MEQKVIDINVETGVVKITVNFDKSNHFSSEEFEKLNYTETDMHKIRAKFVNELIKGISDSNELHWCIDSKSHMFIIWKE